MGQELLKFGNIEFEKNKFYRHKTPDPLHCGQYRNFT